jgi:hypothetical protein
MASASTISTRNPKKALEMKPKPIATYLSLLVPSGLFFAIVWSWLAPGCFYRCADPVPLFSFIPPFVHNHAGKYADNFIAPQSAIYVIWMSFILLAFALPLVGTHLIVRAFKYNRWREVQRVVSSRPPTMRADALPQGK